MADVQLSGVWKSYGGAADVVRDVNLSIKSGEFIVLVGPSGCGKSTTLRMVAGLEEITRGTISIGGRVVNDVHPKDRNIAMVFQNYALYPHMTVRQNMAFALKLRKTPKKEIIQRVQHAADILGLGPYMDRKPKALSGGQRQRVALGRAIVREPDVFLFDEPLSNLDAKLRVTTRGELKALHQRLKTTTIYVTHDQEEAMTLGDRIVVMADGEVQQIGPSLDVFSHPINRFVAGFIGTPPMNFFEGTLGVADGECTFIHPSAPQGLTVVPEENNADIRNALIARTGEPVVLGLRPQAVRLLEEGEHAAAGRVLEGTLSLVEPLGEQIDLHVNLAGNHRAVFRVPSVRGLAAGQSVRLAIDPERLHVFEPGEFGRCLTTPVLEPAVAAAE